jgi:hypothetical protein
MSIGTSAVPRILLHGLFLVAHHPFSPPFDLVDSFEVDAATGSFSADRVAINAPPSTLPNDNYKKWYARKNDQNVSTFNQIC